MATSQNKQTKSSLKVNLMVHKSDQQSLEATLLRWLVTTGRYFVILVEIGVLAAVIWRYVLDAELADLQKKIDDVVPYITQNQSNEAKIRQLQFQLNTIAGLKNERLDYTNLLAKVSAVTPTNVKLTNISFTVDDPPTETVLTLTGTTPSNTELSAFIKALQTDKDGLFNNVSLINMAYESATNFTITSTVTKKTAAKEKTR